MEIISYFDSKTVPISTPSLEDMLRSQVLPQRRSGGVQKKSHVKVKEKKAPFLTIDALCNGIIKSRYVLLITCSALLLAYAGISITLHLQDFAKPLDFQQGVLFEEEVLKNSMQSFVELSSSSQVYEEEALALIAIAESKSLYSQPVSFSNYTVQNGDSIHSISTKFGLRNISTLIGINEIDNVRLLWAGQKITVPSVDGLLYEVKKGDSLESIAKHHSVTIEEILDVNELESSLLHAGETLFVPGAMLDTTTLRQALGELFKHPLSGRWRLSSNYGYRADPFTGVRSFHTGTDFAIAKGTPVRSAMSGTVSTVGYSSVYGYYVIVNHGNGYQTLYAHFMEAAPVSKGQTVSQNSVIGYVGSTGYSTGNHLHFSVYKDGKLVNPKTVLNF